MKRHHESSLNSEGKKRTIIIKTYPPFLFCSYPPFTYLRNCVFALRSILKYIDYRCQTQITSLVMYIFASKVRVKNAQRLFYFLQSSSTLSRNVKKKIKIKYVNYQINENKIYYIPNRNGVIMILRLKRNYLVGKKVDVRVKTPSNNKRAAKSYQIFLHDHIRRIRLYLVCEIVRR